MASLIASLSLAACGKKAEEKSSAENPAASHGEQTVIQYDAIPNYANWGGVTEAYFKKTGVRVPPDMKGSSAAMAALEAEKDKPMADTVYYSGAIGYQAASKGLHQPYKPAGWDKIPDNLKDPEGLWWTVHTAHIALLVNTAALKGKAVPRSFADLRQTGIQGFGRLRRPAHSRHGVHVCLRHQPVDGRRRRSQQRVRVPKEAASEHSQVRQGK